MTCICIKCFWQSGSDNILVFSTWFTFSMLTHLENYMILRCCIYGQASNVHLLCLSTSNLQQPFKIWLWRCAAVVTAIVLFMLISCIRVTCGHTITYSENPKILHNINQQHAVRDSRLCPWCCHLATGWNIHTVFDCGPLVPLCETWRHPQSRKYIMYCIAVTGGLSLNQR